MHAGAPLEGTEWRGRTHESSSGHWSNSEDKCPWQRTREAPMPEGEIQGSTSSLEVGQSGRYDLSGKKREVRIRAFSQAD